MERSKGPNFIDLPEELISEILDIILWDLDGTWGKDQRPPPLNLVSRQFQRWWVMLKFEMEPQC
jgi:hypothetical protein